MEFFNSAVDVLKTLVVALGLFLKLLFHKDSTRQLMEKVFAGNGNFQGEDAGRKRP